MKIITIILLVLIAVTSSAQKIPKDQRTAEDEIKLASKNFYIGFMVVSLVYLGIRFYVLYNPRESLKASVGSLFERSW